ncbi:MAG: RecQ family ATP-dependent DNA helicase [Gemmatimonadota bacterium]|nr:RecQ family ATP-dependent DNA helicase [Gemmatimonadota bacterium]
MSNPEELPDTRQSAGGEPYRPPCVSLDLEVGREDDRIRALAAIRGDTHERITHSGRQGISEALSRLDDLADGASFVLGHNVIGFDLPHLRAARPRLRLLKLPVVDTSRLGPLAFPRHPYHHLVEHHQDGGLIRDTLNDPLLDAGLALRVFGDQRDALLKLRHRSPGLLTAWHWLCTFEPQGVDSALNDFFAELRGAQRPRKWEAAHTIRTILQGTACTTHTPEILDQIGQHRWSLAYALAWLSVAGGKSVMSPWVRHQFPDAGKLVRTLRDSACSDTWCRWCRKHHDAHRQMKRWFGFDSFRGPRGSDGRPYQQAIVEDAMAGKSVLGILPTGTGKSLCYQIPALARYHNTGALTVVISPLVALMADQVKGMESHGIDCCVTVNGLLSMPERAEALERVRLGDAGILLIAPEQLRSRSMRRALDQREIAAWVLDEAHCLSKWGHDFRPDYRYIGRFIKERAEGDEMPAPPVLCLTATAKRQVIRDIREYFRETLGVDVRVHNGGAKRGNLDFEFVSTTKAEKFDDIHVAIECHLPDDGNDGAIIYCATRRGTERVAEFLQAKDVRADFFHAGLPPEKKKEVQRRFIEGDLRVIVATNAFGMGIDKPDVRLVVHADIPGSLENYLQEAGRAGRDQHPARCVLLYTVDDVERQFGMAARSRLTREEIQGILRALSRLDRKNRKHRVKGDREPRVVATVGEILTEDHDRAFERDSATDDNRVRTAVAWLEEAHHLRREENFVRIFPSSLRVNSVEEAEKRLLRNDVSVQRRSELLRIVRVLIQAPPDKGVTTDELMGAAGLAPREVRRALEDLERLGIATNDTALTAYVHRAVSGASKERLAEARELETALISHMRERAPDLGRNESSVLNLRTAAQRLRDDEVADTLPQRLMRIVRSIGNDGREEDDGAPGSLSVRKRGRDQAKITLHREWDALEEWARVRREGAELLLEHLLQRLPPDARGTDLLAETTLGKLNHAIESDQILKQKVGSPSRLMERALLWLHEQEVIRLHKGLVVFRTAMKIRLEPGVRRVFTSADFEPLALHYGGQVLQIHVMVKFAERGLAAAGEAVQLAMDYFRLPEEKFLDRWLPGQEAETARETTPESWQAIVGSLNNPDQQNIVADQRKRTNVLVLAGPGSGKTRVLVHRIAYLVRARRQDARGILALVYNRHAAVEIRQRLKNLIGDDARRVTVMTCHALAMRLAGFSFTGRSERPDDIDFRQVLRRAIDLLRGEGLPPEEADERRERLLAGFRWILVDEYQDIGPDEYELIAALAGRTLDDEAAKLNLFAVGDDDQNIYAFKGASVEFIRRFEEDYSAKSAHLTGNYRSTGHIIAAANAVIVPARERMKAEHPIEVDRARKKDPPGGEWEERDPVTRGRVQILPVGSHPVEQAEAVVVELQRLAALDPDWDWSRCAVMAREWRYLDPVRAFCEAEGIQAQRGDEEIPGFWHLRETQTMVRWLRERDPRIVHTSSLREWMGGQPPGPWNDLLHQAIQEHELEAGESEVTTDSLLEWLAEWGRDCRRRQHGLLLLTAHRAKGLQFDHVAVLDGGWASVGRNEDADAPRRLYYVAMTRARQTLTLAGFQDSPNGLLEALDGVASVFRRGPVPLPSATSAHHLLHRPLGLRDVVLSFAGWRHRGQPVHSAIAALAPGDPLRLRVTDAGHRELLDQSGTSVGRLAKDHQFPAGMCLPSAEVRAIVGWSRELSDPQYRDRARCESWEVVVPRLVFEPE